MLWWLIMWSCFFFWNCRSLSTYLTFSKNMTCHFMMIHIILKKIFQTLSTLLTQSHGFRWTTFPPLLFSPRAAERCTIQGWKSKQSPSFICCRWYWHCGELSMMFKFSNYSPPGPGIWYWWLYAIKWEKPELALCATQSWVFIYLYIYTLFRRASPLWCFL